MSVKETSKDKSKESKRLKLSPVLPGGVKGQGWGGCEALSGEAFRMTTRGLSFQINGTPQGKEKEGKLLRGGGGTGQSLGSAAQEGLYWGLLQGTEEAMWAKF